jgi:hypothetical protein
MLFGMQRRGRGRLPDACIPAPEGAGLLGRSVKCRDSAWRRARDVNRIDTVCPWPRSAACIVSNPQPHKRFSNDKRGSGRLPSSYDHTAIFEKCIPRRANLRIATTSPRILSNHNHRGRHHPAITGRVLELMAKPPGIFGNHCGRLIPQQQDRVLELIVSL